MSEHESRMRGIRNANDDKESSSLLDVVLSTSEEIRAQHEAYHEQRERIEIQKGINKASKDDD